MGLPPGPGTNPPDNPTGADLATGKRIALKDAMAIALGGYPGTPETVAAAAIAQGNIVPDGFERIVLAASVYSPGPGSQACIYLTDSVLGTTVRLEVTENQDPAGFGGSTVNLRRPIRMRAGWMLEGVDDASIGNSDLAQLYVDVRP